MNSGSASLPSIAAKRKPARAASRRAMVATAPPSMLKIANDGALGERLRDRRVDQRPQVPAQGQARLAADHLGHEDDGQLFFWVDPEGCRRSAAPEIFAKRAGQAGFRHVDIDPAAERKADPGIA